MEKYDPDLEHLYQDSAERFKALSQLFGKLGSHQAAQQLIESLVAGDAEAFVRLIEPIEIPGFPRLGKCHWVRELVERVVVIPTGLVEECWLRENLTPAERRLYLQIALRHRQGKPIAGAMEVAMRAGRAVIPPGAFLDELKANGLVTCEQRQTYDTVTTLVLSKPERICV